ncbi:MAG TPA: hypothetical protein DCQ47_02375 [Gammaproteobacteria bacterium]|nr:hypothetical protein [Gammaproteobacteria bacterium]
MFGNPGTTTCGMTLKFQSSIGLDMCQIGSVR